MSRLLRFGSYPLLRLLRRKFCFEARYVDAEIGYHVRNVDVLLLGERVAHAPEKNKSRTHEVAAANHDAVLTECLHGVADRSELHADVSWLEVLVGRLGSQPRHHHAGSFELSSIEERASLGFVHGACFGAIFRESKSAWHNRRTNRTNPTFGVNLNRSDLVRGVAQRTGFTQPEVERVIKTLFDIIALSLACGEQVSIRNFGVFNAWIRKASTHVLAGKEVESPERKTIGFRPADALKQRVNR